MIIMQIFLENEVCQSGCLTKVSFSSIIYLKSQNFIFLTAWVWGKEKGEKIPVFILVCTHLGQITSNTIYVVEQSQ